MNRPKIMIDCLETNDIITNMETTNENQIKECSEAFQSTVASIISLMKKMTDDERMDVMRKFCRFCGCDDPKCQCWNDE